MKSLIRSSVVCPDYHKVYPEIVYGKGVYLYDINGREYLDASAGSAGVSSIGHGVEGIAAVLQEQALKVSILPTHAFSSAIVEEYLEMLLAFSPSGFTRAWTTTSGTEAVENALKLALQFHKLRGDEKRYKIFSRELSYHGNSVFMLDIGGMPLRKKMYRQWLKGFPHISAANLYRKPEEQTEEEYVEQLIAEFERKIQEEDPATCAAFIAEPVVAAAMGAVPPPAGYFERIHAVCKKYGMLFISDEVYSGMGRTGANFAINKFNVIPDIIATGKGISGGYFPLSAVIAGNEIMEPFVSKNTYFLSGHTHACNPMGAAAGKFVLELIEEKGLVLNAENTGTYLKQKLQALYKYDIVGDVRGEGLMIGVELVKNKKTKQPFDASDQISKRISAVAFDEGVVLYPGQGSADGISGDHILITPPLIINSAHCDQIVHAIDKGIRRVSEEI